MAMPMLNITEVNTHLSQLIDLAIAGGEILIAREGKPVARLVPLEIGDNDKKPRILGLGKGHFTIPENFSNPDDEIIGMFEMVE